MNGLAQAAPTTETIRKVKASELSEIAALLARAFHEDPVMKWLVPSDPRRARLLEEGFDVFLRRVYFPEGECYVTQSGTGVAVWEPPGREEPSVLQQLRLVPSLALTWGRYLPRLLGVATAQESNHPREAHYYLAFLGVEPERQCRGIGTRLTRAILDRTDLEGVPTYLEATAPRNRQLYERLGFEVTEEFRVGKGSPPAWRMWRDSGG